jgi:hypothetical protein
MLYNLKIDHKFTSESQLWDTQVEMILIICISSSPVVLYNPSRNAPCKIQGIPVKS